MNRWGVSGRAWVVVAIAAIFGSAAPTWAQGDEGFLRGKGNFSLALSYSLDTYDEFWLGETKVSNDAPGFGRINRDTVNLWVAYGINDEMDIAANISFVHTHTQEIFSDENALQDLTLQFKYRPVSLELGPGKLNFLVDPGLKTPLTHYEDNDVNAVGDGQVDLRFRGIIQYVFNNGIYMALETGYDVRFGPPSDEFPLNFSTGFTVGPVTISGFYSRIDSLGGYDIGQGPFDGVEEDYSRAGGKIYWRITEMIGLAASGWTTFDGKNTGDVDGFSVGLVFDF